MKSKTPLIILVVSLSLLSIGAGLYFLVAPLLVNAVKIELPKSETQADSAVDSKSGANVGVSNNTKHTMPIVRIVLSPKQYYAYLPGQQEILLGKDIDKLKKVVAPYAHSTRPKYQFIIQGDKSLQYAEVVGVLAALRSLGAQPIRLISDFDAPNDK